MGRAGCDEHPRKLFWPGMGCRRHAGAGGVGEGEKEGLQGLSPHTFTVSRG